MNLDDPQSFRALDPEDMLGYITALPDQLEAAWQRARSLPLQMPSRQVPPDRDPTGWAAAPSAVTCWPP